MLHAWSKDIKVRLVENTVTALSDQNLFPLWWVKKTLKYLKRLNQYLIQVEFLILEKLLIPFRWMKISDMI